MNETTIHIIDSHTGGEPTRVVVTGGPDLGNRPLADRRRLFARDHDAFRSTVVNEPRGNDVLVGALLVPPVNPACCAGVIFFNNVGTLGMCGHGAIGLAVTLGRLGRIGAGSHRLETPVGTVVFEYDGQNSVSIENVAAYRYAKAVAVEVPGYGRVVGDVAWGGNWFFLVYDHAEAINRQNIGRLTDFAHRIKQALAAAGTTGKGGEEIDHIELFGPPADSLNDSRNFVLCPGGAYDRSPCGTGTSAKLACLVADGKLSAGEIYRQESVMGSVFEGSVRISDGVVYPRISGTAFITADSRLIVDARDPFANGIRA